MDSLSLQRLKLFSKLDIESQSFDSHAKDDLTESEVFMVDEAFSLRRELSDTEESSRFFISGLILQNYVEASESSCFKSSEFLSLVSRGKLAYPPSELL